MTSFLSQEPSTGHARGSVVIGVDSYLVDVVARITAGPADLVLLGLPKTDTCEARGRVRKRRRMAMAAGGRSRRRPSLRY